MTRTKQTTRNSNLRKRTNSQAQKVNSQEAPPSKKAKKNPLPSTITNPNPAQVPLSSADVSTAPQAHEPIEFKAGDLTNTHDVISLSVISSAKIEQKVTRVLETLSVYPNPPDEKPKVVMLHAKAAVAAKMISIAEIAKREIAKEGGKWFQYNRVEAVMVEQKQRVKKGEENKNNVGGKKNDTEVDENAESDEETMAFETMKTPFERANEGQPKMRALPIMSLYLSRVRIDGLRKAYGEQTNTLQAP